MNRRQAKKKRKKEEQQRAMADFYVTIAELPAIARQIGEAFREALDRLREAISEINVKEVCKQIKADKEVEDGTN